MPAAAVKESQKREFVRYLTFLVFGGQQSGRGSKKLANFDGHLKPGKKVVGRGKFENILTTSFL